MTMQYGLGMLGVGIIAIFVAAIITYFIFKKL